MVQVMGGTSSPYFAEYIKLCGDALLVARRHADEIYTIMDITKFCSSYPAFKYNPGAIEDVTGRLHLKLPDKDIPELAKKLVTR